MRSLTRWGVLFRSDCRLDGYQEHLVWDWKDRHQQTPTLFRTRKEARSFVKERFGYMQTRPDLKAEPHGWLAPQVRKVEVSFNFTGEPI